MIYISTRDKGVQEFFSNAVKTGISKEGGLFVPKSIPLLSEEMLSKMVKKDYKKRAVDVLSLFISDFTVEEISECVSAAYTKQKFGTEEIAPIYKLSPEEYVLELWHGPTCAFKDMALQILPKFLTCAIKKTGENKTVVILVATSGDTGKAALEGFKDVEGTRIIVFYPEDGVSKVQKLQMTTQEGNNVFVGAVKGNFDDAQNGVKAIFTDEVFKEKLSKANLTFSSANSINWGRLVPQIVYYISSYCELIKNSEIAMGEEINVVVPTGNFGNILAAYYAKKMGLPIKTLICASNANNVLTDFLKTGIYDRNRSFYTTVSPSMDILISSNLERLLFDLSGENDREVNALMTKLKKEGRYEVSDKIKEKLSKLFYAGFCDDSDTKKMIHDLFKEESYLVDTHTAVGIKVYRDYRKETNDETKTIIASTASPFKFGTAVLSAIEGEDKVSGKEEFDILNDLNSLSGADLPQSISQLKEKEVRFSAVCEKDQMEKFVSDYLGL